MTLTATSLLLTSTTRADDEHSDATITWTKHVPAFLPPGGDIFATIAGVAAGDIGSATLTGDAFNPVAPLAGGKITFEGRNLRTGRDRLSRRKGNFGVLKDLIR